MHSAKGEQCMDLLCMQNYSPVIIMPVAPLCSFKKSAAQMGIEPYTCKIVCSSLEQNLNHIQIWNQVPCPIAWRAARSQIKVEKCSRGSPFPVTEQGVFVVAVCFVFCRTIEGGFLFVIFCYAFSFCTAVQAWSAHPAQSRLSHSGEVRHHQVHN